MRRSLEHTVVPSIGAGEAAPLVTEELALNEHGRERAAIQCDIRPVPPSAQVVKGSRDQVRDGKRATRVSEVSSRVIGADYD